MWSEELLTFQNSLKSRKYWLRKFSRIALINLLLCQVCCRFVKQIISSQIMNYFSVGVKLLRLLRLWVTHNNKIIVIIIIKIIGRCWLYLVFLSFQNKISKFPWTPENVEVHLPKMRFKSFALHSLLLRILAKKK